MSKNQHLSNENTTVICNHTPDLFSSEPVTITMNHPNDTEFLTIERTATLSDRDTFALTVTLGTSKNERSLAAFSIDRDATIFVYFTEAQHQTLWRIRKSNASVTPIDQETVQKVRDYAATLFETASDGNSGKAPMRGSTWRVKVVAEKNQKGEHTAFRVEDDFQPLNTPTEPVRSSQGFEGRTDTPRPSPPPNSSP